MHVDWRGLLDHLRVEWQDRGPNTSKNNVNIRCPWCRDDPSYHLAISLEHDAYYCYREPNRHSGQNLTRLLTQLGVSYSDCPHLLNHYNRGLSKNPKRRPEVDTRPAPSSVTRAWERFHPAAESPRCVAYLHRRGFETPRFTCEHHDLRYATEGMWANRLLIPITKVTTGTRIWTGRALLGQMTPRYLFQQVSEGPFIYCPDLRKQRPGALVIVEGPLDALKISDACVRLPIIAAALQGKEIGASKLRQLIALSESCSTVLLAMDADVSVTSVYQIANEIQGALHGKRVARARLPVGYKDPAEIPTEELRQWITGNVTSAEKQNARY